MFKIKQDILKIQRGIIVQQGNAQGFCGAGLALDTKVLYPEAMEMYSKRKMGLGSCFLAYASPGNNALLLSILIGQFYVGTHERQTNYGALSDALGELRRLISANSYQYLPVYFPYKMSCNLAGGSWLIVEELLEYYFPGGYICKLE